MGRKGWAAGAVLVAAGIAAAVVLGGRARQAADGEETLETAVVTRGTLLRTVGGTGSLVPASEVATAFAMGGEVTEVRVEVGRQVAAGETLAVLDTASLASDVVSAEAGVASAESGLASAREGLSSVEAGATDIEERRARVQLEQARDRLWGSQAQRDGVCGRVEAKRGEPYECDNANAGVLQAEDAVRLAELDLQDLQAGPTDEELAAARDRVVQAESGLASARVKLEQAERKLRDAILTAPITGTVTALEIAAGEMVSAGTPAVTIGDLTSLQVAISLDEADIAGVTVGDEAVVVLDALPDREIEGAVVSVAPVAQIQSGVVLFPVTVALEAVEADVRPGMTADVEIVTGRAADALVVPLRSVVTTAAGTVVMRVGAGSPGRAGGRPKGAFEGQAPATETDAEPVSVEIGLTNETQAEVKAGLAEGDVVLVRSRAASGDAMPMGGPGMPMGVFRGR